MRLAIVLSLLLLCSSSLFVEGDSPQILPDRDIQDRLERLADAKPTQLVFYEHVIALREATRVRGAKQMIEQAAWLSSRSKDWKAFNYATWQLQLGDGHLITKTLVPYLDSDDEALREFVDRYIGTGTPAVEKDNCDPKIQALIDFIAENPTRFPQRAAPSLYWQAPSAAFLGIAAMLVRDQSTLKQPQSAEHLISHAIWKEWRGLKPDEFRAALDELVKLSESDSWWVKLYVAEMLRRHEMFRRNDIVERLRKDRDPLVAKAVDAPYDTGMNEDERNAWKKLPGTKSR